MYSPGTLARVADHFPTSKYRIVLLNRRGYQGSQPVSPADLTLLEKPDEEGFIERFCLYMKHQAQSLLEALVALKKSGVSKVETGAGGKKQGGICLVGWSMASFFMKSILAYLEELDAGAVDELEPYMRDFIMFGERCLR